MKDELTYEYSEGYANGWVHGERSDFPYSTLEMEAYPPLYRQGYERGYWERRAAN